MSFFSTKMTHSSAFLCIIPVIAESEAHKPSKILSLGTLAPPALLGCAYKEYDQHLSS